MTVESKPAAQVARGNSAKGLDFSRFKGLVVIPMSAIPDDMRAIFEAQWPIYRKVIDHDYMEHAAIHRALSGHVANNPGF